MNLKIVATVMIILALFATGSAATGSFPVDMTFPDGTSVDVIVDYDGSIEDHFFSGFYTGITGEFDITGDCVYESINYQVDLFATGEVRFVYQTDVLLSVDGEVEGRIYNEYALGSNMYNSTHCVIEEGNEVEGYVFFEASTLQFNSQLDLNPYVIYRQVHFPTPTPTPTPTEIPEFPTIVVPMIGILGMLIATTFRKKE